MVIFRRLSPSSRKERLASWMFAWGNNQRRGDQSLFKNMMAKTKKTQMKSAAVDCPEQAQVHLKKRWPPTSQSQQRAQGTSVSSLHLNLADRRAHRRTSLAIRKSWSWKSCTRPVRRKTWEFICCRRTRERRRCSMCSSRCRRHM